MTRTNLRVTFAGVLAAALAAAVLAVPAPAGAATVTQYTRVSTATSASSPAVAGGALPVQISDDGRYVAYVQGSPPYALKFHDRETGTTTTISSAVSSFGGMSDDGGELVWGETAGLKLWRRATGVVTTVVSSTTAPPGLRAGGGGYGPAISGDGDRVAFWGTVGIQNGDPEESSHVYLWNRLTQAVTQVTPKVTPQPTNIFPGKLSLSDDGSVLVMNSTRELIAGQGTGAYRYKNGVLSKIADEGGTVYALSSSGRYVGLRPALSPPPPTPVPWKVLDLETSTSVSLPMSVTWVHAFEPGDATLVASSDGAYHRVDRATGTIGGSLPGTQFDNTTTTFDPSATPGLYAFATDAALVASDTNGVTDVYVAEQVEVPDEDPPTTAPAPPTPSNPTGSTVVITSPVVSGFGTGGRGDPPTGYRFFLYEGTSATPVQTKDATAAVRKVTFGGLTAGVRYRFKAAAFNTGGVGPSSGYSSFVLLPFLNFDTFTTRQYLDFAGRNPTTAEKTDWNTKLTNGTLTAAGAVNTAVDFTHHQKQSPVIRLFRAYFLRLPDKGGLDYWTTKHRTGTTLNTISQSFAGSAEFKTRYGSLTNQAFVELVYTNVLGRPGEPAGVTYWTSELNKGTKTRGQVMAGFSESGEYKNKTKALVDTVNVFTGMLRRIPTSGEAATWAPTTNPPTRPALITHILATTEYDNRV